MNTINKKNIKLTILLIVGLSVCAPALAVGETNPPVDVKKVTNGVFTVVPYGNNPFEFCLLGMPEDGWVAVNPATGAWTPIEQYPNLTWVPAYVAVCPAAFPKGISDAIKDKVGGG